MTAARNDAREDNNKTAREESTDSSTAPRNDAREDSNKTARDVSTNSSTAARNDAREDIIIDSQRREHQQFDSCQK